MPAQQYRVSIPESCGDFISQLFVADQHRGIVDRRAAIKMHAAVGDHFDPLSGNTHCYNLVRMVVQDALYVGPCFVDRGMHRGLAIGLTKALELLSVHVENNKVAQCDLARWHMRRAKDSLATQAR